MKKIIKSILSNAGLELRRNDPSLPLLHQVKLDDLNFSMWLTNNHAKDWWYKPQLEFNAEFSFIKKACKKGSTVFDIGAHHGVQTIPMSLWTAQQGKVYAFEANRSNAITLQANINLNKLNHTYGYYCAVGNHTGEIQITGETVNDDHHESIPTPCYALDTFCAEHSIQTADFIKIDVEGYELQVLEGAQRMLSQRPYISLELHINEIQMYGGKTNQVMALIDWDQYNVSAMDRNVDWGETTLIKSTDQLPENGIINLFFEPVQ